MKRLNRTKYQTVDKTTIAINKNTTKTQYCLNNTTQKEELFFQAAHIKVSGLQLPWTIFANFEA